MAGTSSDELRRISEPPRDDEARGPSRKQPTRASRSQGRLHSRTQSAHPKVPSPSSRGVPSGGAVLPKCAQCVAEPAFLVSGTLVDPLSPRPRGPELQPPRSFGSEGTLECPSPAPQLANHPHAAGKPAHSLRNAQEWTCLSSRGPADSV